MVKFTFLREAIETPFLISWGAIVFGGPSNYWFILKRIAVLVNVCEADLPFDWRGRLLTSEGIYSDTARYTATSCDSIRFNLELTIDSVSYDSSYQVVCQENLPLLWRGQSITQNGWFYDTVFAQSGCDSMNYATLVVD